MVNIPEVSAVVWGRGSWAAVVVSGAGALCSDSFWDWEEEEAAGAVALGAVVVGAESLGAEEACTTAGFEVEDAESPLSEEDDLAPAEEGNAVEDEASFGADSLEEDVGSGSVARSEEDVDSGSGALSWVVVEMVEEEG